MKISAIAAMGKNRVIGKDNRLMWKLPLEMKHFKETTTGHHMIMGRKTFESHPKPLPNRTSIVLTRNTSYEVPEGCFTAQTFEEALQIAKDRGESEVFVTGGAEIYTLSLPFLNQIYLTEIDFDQEGDAYFPKFDLEKWTVVREDHMSVGEKNNLAWTMRIYTKK